MALLSGWGAVDELLQRVRAGDPEATAELVARFQPPGRRLAEALLGDAARAEDAVQEAFLLALGRLEQLRAPEAFSGWFRQLVRTAAGRIARRRGEDPLPAALDPPSPADEPHQVAAADELRDRLRAALRRLPPAGRRTAELFYVEGRGVSEVAEALDVPVGTVKRRLHDARARLRDLMLGAGQAGAPDETAPAGSGPPL